MSEVIIKRVFPNPPGNDPAGEWIELQNLKSTEINLTNWKIKDKSDKVFEFKELKIKPQQTIRLFYSQTKIVLNNNGDTLFLLDPDDNLVDKLEYFGRVKPGQVIKKAELNQKQNFQTEKLTKNSLNLEIFFGVAIFILFLSTILTFIFKNIYEKVFKD